MLPLGPLDPKGVVGVSDLLAKNRIALVLSVLGLAGISALLFTTLWFLSFGPSDPGLGQLWTSTGVATTVGGLGEVTVAVLGIALTVVAIIVELAANRYTPRITELFLRDPVNILVLSTFVVTTTLVVWTSMSLHGPTVPGPMVFAALGAMSLSLLALLPYFAYVFRFLAPTRVVERLRRNVSHSMLYPEAPRARENLAKGIEQLGEMVLNSVAGKDKTIAISGINALYAVGLDFLTSETVLPERWADPNLLHRGDQDFVAMHERLLAKLAPKQRWILMKVLRQYQTAFAEGLEHHPDINHLIAIRTRQLIQSALQRDDRDSTDLAIRFLNTYLRKCINTGNVPNAYNVFNEYRILGGTLIDAGVNDLALQVAERFRYYGLLAFHDHQAFTLETAAYDLSVLIEQAYLSGAVVHDQLLELFLDVDREPEGDRSQEVALRGVRKAQVKLATFYLEMGSDVHARRVYEDMKDEIPERLQSIRAELQAISQPEFWEVTDRGVNFDYLPEARREKLSEFFGWFGGSAAFTESIGGN
jgi:hypothetical protein